MDPLISVVVPLYNYSNFIADCIKSITSQDYDNYELIIVDDCSTDDSYAIASSYASSKIKIIHHEQNRGYSAAKNTGIVASKGEYICLLDADDMMTTDSLSLRIAALLKHKVPFVHANVVAIYDNFTYKQCRRLKNIPLCAGSMRSNKIPCKLQFPSEYDIHAQTVLLHRDLYVKYGLYDERLRSRSDREMWWRFFGQSSQDKAKINRVYIDRSVAYYRYHTQSMMVMRSRNKDYDRNVRALSEQVAKVRREEGITQSNTIFLK